MVTGINIMMQSITQEQIPHRIYLNRIAPGTIKTPINKLVWDTPEAEAKLLELITTIRVGDIENIGKAVVWLLMMSLIMSMVQNYFETVV